MTLEALLAIALTCQTLPASMVDIVIGNALANENGALNEHAVVHEPNGTHSYGIGMVNDVNLDWTGLRGREFDVCANLTAASKVFLVKYNGNPPDSIKSVYAARAMMKIAEFHMPTEQSKSAPKPTKVGQLSRPVRSSRDLLSTRQ